MNLNTVFNIKYILIYIYIFYYRYKNLLSAMSLSYCLRSFNNKQNYSLFSRIIKCSYHQLSSGSIAICCNRSKSNTNISKRLVPCKLYNCSLLPQLKPSLLYQNSLPLHTSSSTDASKDKEKLGFFRKLWVKSKYSDSQLLRIGYAQYSSMAASTDVLHFFKGNMHIQLSFFYMITFIYLHCN